MKFTVDMWNNFCRVFELPEEFVNEYCHGGGHPTNFQMVDWFNPTQMGTAACSKEVWEKEVGKIETQEIDLDELVSMLGPFVSGKMYAKEGRSYLVLCDFGAAFTINC